VDFDPARLRRGEWIAGASAVLMLVFVFVLPWYGLTSTVAPPATRLASSTSINGWDGLPHVRWLVLVTVLGALALIYFQASRQAPALAVSISVIVTVLGILTLLALLYRVVINVPGPDGVLEARAGAYLGLASALGVAYGAYASLRTEGIAERDGPGEIPTVRLGNGP
jgi:predicted signal transduction protein with EAL and GGDEF domain